MDDSINTVGELTEFLQQYDGDMQLIVTVNANVINLRENDFTLNTDVYDYPNNQYLSLDIEEW